MEVGDGVVERRKRKLGQNEWSVPHGAVGLRWVTTRDVIGCGSEVAVISRGGSNCWRGAWIEDEWPERETPGLQACC